MTDELTYMEGLPPLPATTPVALAEMPEGTVVAACSPLLVAETKGGGPKFYQGFALVNPATGEAWTRSVTFARTGKPGAYGLKEPKGSPPRRVQGKNAGRSNATTPETQAVFNCGSDERDKRKQMHWDAGAAKPWFYPRPMLAEKYSQRSHNISFPAAAQPKFDGHRMIFDGEIGCSREGIPYIPAVIQHLVDQFGALVKRNGVYLDGEMLLPALPGESRVARFQRTGEAIKKHRPDWDKLVFHVYDVYIPDRPKATFEERFEVLETLANEALSEPALWTGDFHLDLVAPFPVENDEELMDYANSLMNKGWEGAMVRNWSGIYLTGFRSEDLQKIKNEDQSEFLMVTYYEAEGSDEGSIVFGLITGDEHPVAGMPFKARPMGDIEKRRQWYRDGDALVKALTRVSVNFDGYTKDGVPRCPRAVDVRQPGF